MIDEVFSKSVSVVTTFTQESMTRPDAAGTS